MIISKHFEDSEILQADMMDIMKRFPDNHFDCLVTDCPYRISSGGSTGHDSFLRTDKKNLQSGRLFEHNEIEFSDWLPEVYRVLKSKSHAYIMVNGRNLSKLQSDAESVGFRFQNLLVWKKNNQTPNRYYMQQAEFILMLRKGKARNINSMGISNILEVPVVINRHHPTQKPIELMQILIENSTDQGNVVLDPFAGSGTTGLACMRSKRKFVMIEKDPRYYEVALQRIHSERQSETLSLFPEAV